MNSKSSLSSAGILEGTSKSVALSEDAGMEETAVLEVLPPRAMMLTGIEREEYRQVSWGE